MRRQTGGAVRYEIPPELNSPEKVLALIRERAVNLPIPSQTIGVCALDSIISGLLYPSGVSDYMWRYIFERCVRREVPDKLVIFVPDDYLSLASLRALAPEERVNRQIDAFLATSGARVLRILANIDGSSRAIRRELSFASAAEMHGSSPSILCATLASALGREEREAPRVYAAIEGVTPPNPDSLALDNAEAAVALKKILTRVQPPGLGIQLNEAPVVLRRRIAAVFVTLSGMRSEEWRTAARTQDFHAIALVRIAGLWYVADDNMGRLLKLNSGSPLDSKQIQGSFVEFDFTKIAEEDRDAHNIPAGAYPLICQYRLVSMTDWKKVIASTDETFKIRFPGDDAHFLKWSSRPVGMGGAMAELHGLVDGRSFYPPGLYRYYRNLEPTNDEVDEANDDIAEVQEADVERGKAFLLKRGVGMREILEDSETLRRVGKYIVRKANVPIEPYILKPERIYLTVPAAPTGGRRYSRRSKQWGSRKVAASSTRRRGSRRPKA